MRSSHSIFDDGDQRAVARRLGDAQVEEAVAGERLRLAVELALHRVQRFLDRGDLRLLRRLRGERRAFAFDHVARAQQFERPGLGVDRRTLVTARFARGTRT